MDKPRLTYLAGGHLPERQAIISSIRHRYWEYPVTLVREPVNPFDQNAIAVHVPGGQIGYIKAEKAAEMAPFMDTGQRHFVCWISEVSEAKSGKLNVALYVQEYFSKEVADEARKGLASYHG